jgi:Zn-finger nucleic acid-binding protein
LRCPVCDDPMIVLELEQIEIDHCLSCRGIWLDGGELELLLEGADNASRLMSTLVENKTSKEKKIKCPICYKKLIKTTVGTDKPVYLDVCPKKDGLWFDRGELVEVVNMGQFPEGRRIGELLKELFGNQD